LGRSGSAGGLRLGSKPYPHEGIGVASWLALLLYKDDNDFRLLLSGGHVITQPHILHKKNNRLHPPLWCYSAINCTFPPDPEMKETKSAMSL